MSGIYSRWGREIGSDKKWEVLKKRLIILFGEGQWIISKIEARGIAFDLGEDVTTVATETYGGECILNSDELIDETNEPFELALLLETFFRRLSGASKVIEVVVEIVNSADCGINFKKTKEGWQTYPTGEKILDRELVDKPLSFLINKPLIEYGKAIDHYSAKKWEESAEKVRRTLEEYLRQKLKNEKGLDKAITELGTKISADENIPNHFKNTIVGVLKILDKNFNESSKHNSKTYDEKECEFLIYQAGLLMVALEKIELK